MVKKLSLLICMVLCITFTGCTASDPNTDQNADTDRLVTKSYGSFTLPATWVEFTQMSSDSKTFYVKEGISTASPTSNISVEMGTNQYALSDHESFRYAILQQLGMQMETLDTSIAGQVEGGGSNTENGYILYTFKIPEESIDTIQYYIVDDYRYVLIHVTDFRNEQIPDVIEAAETMVNTFQWDE